ncbi:MAG TPA: hypothetical protein VND90_08955 [Terracidiphilus sp.]|nr:hypothetical protein [Terracidiphilus sp.]
MFYYEGRWLIRWSKGRFEWKERRAAVTYAVFGGLIIPIIYFAAILGEEFSGELEKMFAAWYSIVVGAGVAALAGRVFVHQTKDGK